MKKPRDLWRRLAGAVPALRKRLRETKLVQMDWSEIAPMAALVVLGAVLLAAGIEIFGEAAFLVIPYVGPPVVGFLFLVWLLKLAAGSAGDE